MIAITGNTYPVKDQLLAMGCWWNGQAKLWYAPDCVADAARKLVKSHRRASKSARSNRR
jgi:hypothetical protein